MGKEYSVKNAKGVSFHFSPQTPYDEAQIVVQGITPVTLLHVLNIHTDIF